MQTWMVALAGSSFDLEELPRLFTAPSMRVEQRDEGYFLLSSDFEGMPDARPVYSRGQELVRMMNALAKLKWPSFKDVSVGHVRGVGDAPGITVQITVTDSIGLRDKARVTKFDEDGKEIPQSDAIDEWAQVALAHPEVARAIEQFSSGNGWTGLWNAFEIVQGDVGSEMFSRGWSSRTSEQRFSRSVNDPRIAGEGARHAVPQGDPLSNPMRADEAREYVAGVLKYWISWKASSATV